MISLDETMSLARAAQRRLDDIDDRIRAAIAGIEESLRARGVRRIVRVKMGDGAELAWSGAKRWWRFVVRDGDDVAELAHTSREERAEVFSCGAMATLLKELM